MKYSVEEAYSLYTEYCYDLKYRNRFFVKEIITKIFDRIIESNVETESEGITLFRGRINEYQCKEPYCGKDIGMPDPKVLTSHGRANPFGINYIYLSNNSETVIAELRPNIDSYVSIGQFELLRDIKIVKLADIASSSGTLYDEIPSMFVSDFMLYLLSGFTGTINNNNKELEYLPFQYFAEYCKIYGIEGIKFLSSVMNNSNAENYNYVIFNDKYVEWKKTQVYQVTEINHKTNLVSN